MAGRVAEGSAPGDTCSCEGLDVGSPEFAFSTCRESWLNPVWPAAAALPAWTIALGLERPSILKAHIYPLPRQPHTASPTPTLTPLCPRSAAQRRPRHPPRAGTPPPSLCRPTFLARRRLLPMSAGAPLASAPSGSLSHALHGRHSVVQTASRELLPVC